MSVAPYAGKIIEATSDDISQGGYSVREVHIPEWLLKGDRIERGLKIIYDWRASDCSEAELLADLYGFFSEGHHSPG